MMEWILGILGVCVTSLLTVYGDKLLNFAVGGRKHKWLKGEWQAEWEFSTPEELAIYKAKYPQFIVRILDNTKDGIADSITIEKVYGKIISGVGRHPERGTWKFTGRIEHSTIRCHYTSDAEGFKNLAGVFILQFDENIRNKMDGKWLQNTSLQQGLIIGGDAVWRR
ncbi:MAG: hypothetical protein ACKVOR_05215 [Flavobacteriales bacterium]